MLDTTRTLGDIAADLPLATQVFLRHRLDFCCGGGQPLDEACRELGLDPATVAGEIEERLAREDTPPRSWRDRPIADLVQHIITRYHEPLWRDLRPLVEAARKVERVHHDKPTCPEGLAVHLASVVVAVEEHLTKEENILFPLLQRGQRGLNVQMPIAVMTQEHDDHGTALARTRELARDFVAPPEACATWRALYASLESLERDLMEHIHLENSVLFPRALSGR